MKADLSVTITPDTLREWQKEAAQLLADADAKKAQANTLLARVEAGRLLLGIDSISATGAKTTNPDEAAALADVDAAEVSDAGPNMAASIEMIVNTSDKPLTKGTLKSRLMMLGFPEERMGNYFYTVIARLKGKKRIAVQPDGRVWKAGA
jgi:hypothetical protein